MKPYWAYRLLFFACIALSIGGVMFTISARQRGAARVEASRPRSSVSSRGRDPQEDRSAVIRQNPASSSAATLMSRVRITTVVPFRREVHLYNFGEAAEDLTGWRLASPRPNGEDAYVFPVGTLLLPGESLIVVAEDGLDSPGELHWRVPGDRRVLELTGDTVMLVDDRGSEVSRFQYVRS